MAIPPYRLADQTIKKLNRLALRRVEKAKRKFSTLGFDELNVFREVSSLYAQMDADNRKQYRKLYRERYLEVLLAASAKMKEPDEDEVDDLVEIELAKILSDPDGITHYEYDSEVNRKRDRAIEAINSVPTKLQKQLEVQKALRLWVQMSQQYADVVSDDANVQALEDDDVEYVVWHSQEDDKVCNTCDSLDGKVFRIDKIPEKPHWRCRCWVESAELSKKTVENADKDDIMRLKAPEILKLQDIVIGRSVGAKAKNYDIMDLATGEYFNLVEGEHLQNVEVFAGKGVRTPYRKADIYAEKIGGKAEDWQHVKAIAKIDYYGEPREANIHWSQCDGIGKYDFFIKEWLE